MYFVEQEPGNVAVYDSADDLSQAIRGGVVGPNSRIFHHQSSQWLPITTHPLYRRTTAQTANETPPLGRRQWTFFPGPSTDANSADEPSALTVEWPEEMEEASPELPAAKTRWPRWLDSLRAVIAKILSLPRLKAG